MKYPATFFLFVMLAFPAPADIPQAIPHQGRIAVDGINFDGTGQFKFLLFGDMDSSHASGNEVAVWSNTTTSPVDMSEPAAAVPLAVTKGLYSVWLGDTSLPNMAALPSAFDPSDAQLYLRLWFDDSTHGFQQLDTDQPVGSVAYALLAQSSLFSNTAGTAQSVQGGAVGSAQIQNESILGIDIAPGAVATSEVLDGTLRLADFDLPDIDTRYTPQNAQTIIVDASGGAAFTTIGAAIASVTPTLSNPVIIEVRPGTYNESVTLKSFLHLKGAGKDHCTLIPPSASALDSVGLKLTDLTGVRISGFTFTEAPSGAADAGIQDVRSSPVIHDCRFIDIDSAFGNSTETGGVTSSDSSLVIFRCEFDNESNGVVFSGQSRALVHSCTFGESSIFDPNMTGIRCVGSSCRVIGNSFSTQDVGVVCEAGPGLTASKIVVAGNRFSQVGRGLDVASNCFATIIGNVFEGVRQGERGVNNSGVAIISGNTFCKLGDFAVVANGTTTNLNGNHIDNCGPSGGGQAAAIDGGAVTVSGNSFANNVGDFGPNAPNVGLAWFDNVHFEADPGSGLLAGPRLGVGPIPFEPTVEFEVRGQSVFAGPANFSSTTTFTGPTELFNGFDVIGATVLNGDVDVIGELNVVEPAAFQLGMQTNDIDCTGNIVAQGILSAAAYTFPTPKNLTCNVPGNSLHPSRETEDVFRSSLGYITLENSDTNFAGVAPVQLPQGAKIKGYDLMYYDNSGTMSFTNFTTRLRRRAHLSAGNQNIGVLDVTTPSSPNNTSIVLASDNPAQFVPARATVDNNSFAYHVSIDFTVTGNDGINLRCFGFRVRYTLDDLLP